MDLATWLHARTGELDPVSRGRRGAQLRREQQAVAETPFEDVWVQPVAGDAGTSLGAALQLTADLARDNGGPQADPSRLPLSVAAGLTTS